MANAVLFGGVYAPDLSPLGLVTSDTADRTLSLLPAGGATRAQKFTDIYAPVLGATTRISAFGLTSDEAIVLGTTGGGGPVNTETWFMG